MEASEDLEEVAPDHRISVAKNVSDSNTYLKRMLITADDETNGSVQIGLKVNFDDEYSVALKKDKSKSDDYLRIVADPQKTCVNHSLGDVRMVERKFFKDPKTTVSPAAWKEHMPSRDTDSEDDKPRAVPILKLKLPPVSKGSSGFELCIKSINEDRALSSEDEGSYSDNDIYETTCESEDASETYSSKAVSSYSGLGEYKQSTQDNASPLTQVMTVSTQTKEVIQSSSIQTETVEIINLRNVKETIIQTEGKRDASTLTDAKKTKSIKTETDEFPKRHISVQTEEETVTSQTENGSSQTETAVLHSKASAYDVSAQTQQIKDAETLTDSNTCIMDRGELCDKAEDNTDLPVHWMIARKESASGDKNLTTEENNRFHYTCDYQSQHGKVNRSYCPIPEESVKSSSPVHCLSQHDTACTYEESTNDFCHRSPKIVSNEMNRCNAKCSSDIEEKVNSDKIHVIEKLKTPEYLYATIMQFKSIGFRKNINNPSHLKVVKNLDSGLVKIETVVAEQVFSTVKIERARTLKIPITIFHFLQSFSLSSPFRVAINPIGISQFVNQAAVSKSSATKDLKVKVKQSSGKEIRDESGNKLLMLFGDMGTHPVVVCHVQPSVPVGDKYSKLCLCSHCYGKVKGTVLGKQMIHQQTSDLFTKREDNKMEKISQKDLSTSTSPKIKRKNFDYTSREPWKPFGDMQDHSLSQKTESTDFIDVGDRGSSDSSESGDGINLNFACETVNDHLLRLKTVNEDQLKKSAETLHKTWFETAATKHSDVYEVRNYLRFFQEFSFNLLKTLLHSVDSNGNNVLHFAYANSRFDIVEELLCTGYGVDLLIKTNKSGNSPLMICSISQPKSEKEWSIIRKSFEMGDVNIRSVKSDQTPLMNAASCGFGDMVELLLKIGADPNLQDKDGSTALMYAAEHGHEKCAKALLTNGKCDPTIRDTDGQTACSIALTNGHKNIAVLIHMQEIKKRRLLQPSFDTKRYVRTNKLTRRQVSSSLHRF